MLDTGVNTCYTSSMKTTHIRIRLDDLAKIKKLAKMSGLSLASVLNRILRKVGVR